MLNSNVCSLLIFRFFCRKTIVLQRRNDIRIASVLFPSLEASFEKSEPWIQCGAYYYFAAGWNDLNKSTWKRHSRIDVSIRLSANGATILAPTRVHINKATELLTCFTVSAGKARLTVALVFMMDVFITCSSVFTTVIFVTMQFCNTSIYLPLKNTTCHIHTCTRIHYRQLLIQRHSFFIRSLFPSVMLRRMLHKLIYIEGNGKISYVITLSCIK